MKNALKELMDSRGVTRYRLWKLTGLAQNTAYRLYDDSEYVPGGDVMDSVCAALDCQPGDWLVYIPDESGGKGGKESIATDPDFEIGDCIKNPRGERGYVSGIDGDRVFVDMEASGSDSYPAHLLELVHKSAAAA